jgi:hypothetical protein
MLPHGFTPAERQILAKAVVESATSERRILVDTGRKSGPSALGEQKMEAERLIWVGFAKCQTPRRGTKQSIPPAHLSDGYRQKWTLERCKIATVCRLSLVFWDTTSDQRY